MSSPLDIPENHRIPVLFPTELPAGWSWALGDPYTGRAHREGGPLYVRRVKAGGGDVAGLWQVRDQTNDRMVTGGHCSPLDAALAAEEEAAADAR